MLPTNLIWCLGMYASGSTWLFNVVRTIAQTSMPISSRFIHTTQDLAGLNTSGKLIVKTHETEPPAAVWLTARAGTILITLRDPRDAVVSLMRYQKHDFAKALSLAAHSAEACTAQAADPRALLLRYEDGFASQPQTVAQLAQHLNLPVEAATAERIFQAHSRAAVESHIATLAQARHVLHEVGGTDYMDPHTQWHRHHAGRTGASGTWRHSLNAAQISAIKARLAPWMQEWGYIS